MVGTSIVLAGQALDGEGERGGEEGRGRTSDRAASTSAARPTATHAASPVGRLPPAPVLEAPEADVTQAEAIDVRGRLPGDVPRDAAYRLRVYVNDTPVVTRRVPRRRAFVVRNVPLEEGPNSITAAIRGPDGEGLPSRPVGVVRDGTAPNIEIVEPDPARSVHTQSITLRGLTEPQATVRVGNETTGSQTFVRADDEGAFQAGLTLEIGDNEIFVDSEDVAGNMGRITLTLVHQEAPPRVRLWMSPGTIELSRLPVNVTITVRVSDAAGEPVDGADVTFSISPPGQPTSTYRTTSRNGIAVWRGLRLPREGASRGQGFATVMIVTPDDETLQDNVFFRIR